MSQTDWASFESEFAQRLESFARDAIENNPDQHVYCVAVWLFYGDYTILTLPIFSAATREWLEAQDPDERDRWRWAAPDYPIQSVESEGYRRLSDWVTAQARAAGGQAGQVDEDAWDEVSDRLEAVVVAAARATTDNLRADGVVEDDFIVVPLDGDWDPDLTLAAQTLTEAELQARPDLAALIQAH